MIVSAPMDAIEMRNIMYTAQLEKNNIPFSIRYPKGSSLIADWHKPFSEIEVGKARLLSEGDDIAVLSIGHPGNTVAAVAANARSRVSLCHSLGHALCSSP